MIGGKGEVRHIMPIHHVEVKRIHSCFFGALHFVAQAGIIRSKQGCTDVYHLKQARSGEYVE